MHQQQLYIYNSEEIRVKKCTKCLDVKTENCFHKHKRQADGLNPVCKDCRKKEYKLSNSKQKKQTQKPKSKRKQEDRRTKMLANARGRALKKHIPFNLSKKDVIIPNRCPIFGIEISETNEQVSYDSPTLDRINPDPKIGYVKGNVHVISCRANMLKNNATIEELETLLKWMKRNNTLDD